MCRRLCLCTPLLVVALHTGALAQSPVSYTLSFPERAQRLMHVAVTFPDVPPGTLELRMSRTSPGRYALHEFAKNVFDVRVVDGDGRPLAVTRPDPHGWEVADHGGSVQVTYRIYGDRVDGTYLAVDDTHAHINMPASLMWARGFEDRPAMVRFERPPGSRWQVVTQLQQAGDAFTYLAPNLQFLMDSPTEVSRFTLRTFTVPDEPRTPVFRVAVHHEGSEADVDRFARDVEAIVRESRHVFGEFPAFEGNTYTFIADYLPWASGDGMEHRNSTILTSSTSIAGNRTGLLDTAAHEFFHAWNVERIRPASLEPFDFEAANMSGELWLAEGFTSYYGPLLLQRAGLTSVEEFAAEMGEAIDVVRTSPGRQVRSVVEMSRFAPFVDDATSTDPTNYANTYISYYTWGSALGLGLDLLLRDRSDNRVTLDDYMRVLWQRFGRSGEGRAGHVDTPYTPADLRAVLADVAGDAAFAEEYFARYVDGREMVEYGPPLARAGFVLRSRSDQAFAGALRLQSESGGVRITADVPLGSPAYHAGLARGDLITAVGDTDVTSAGQVQRLVTESAPGDELPVLFERQDTRLRTVLRLAEDPHVEVVPVEATGGSLTSEQRAFRDDWLGSRGGF